MRTETITHKIVIDCEDGAPVALMWTGQKIDILDAEPEPKVYRYPPDAPIDLIANPSGGPALPNILSVFNLALAQENEDLRQMLKAQEADMAILEDERRLKNVYREQLEALRAVARPSRDEAQHAADAKEIDRLKRLIETMSANQRKTDV